MSATEHSSQDWLVQLRSEQPIAAALFGAILARCTQFIEKGNSGAYTLEAFNDDLDVLGKEIAELSTWLVGVKPERTEEQICQLVNAYTGMHRDLGVSGYQLTQIGKLAEAVMLKKPRGRPPDRKRRAVKAYELKIANPGFTWNDVADVLCDCKKSEHDESCREAIRQGVIELQRTLKKYDVKVPALP